MENHAVCIYSGVIKNTEVHKSAHENKCKQKVAVMYLQAPHYSMNINGV